MQSKNETTEEQVNRIVDVYIGRKGNRGVRTFRSHKTTRLTRAFFSTCFTAAGLFGVGVGCRYLIGGLLKPHELFWAIPTLFLLLLGGWMAWVGIYMLRLQIHMARTSPADKVCSRLGIQEELLKTIAEERGIKPQYNVDGHDYYNMADFKDIGSLLRASQQPTAATETLLRPTANAETSPETLLRADNTVSQVTIAAAEEQTTELKVGINKR